MPRRGNPRAGAVPSSSMSEERNELAPGTMLGAYRVEYRGLSADGHVGGGAVRFRVEAGAR